MRKIKLELQYFEGCPHYAEMKNRILQSLEAYKDFVDFSENEIHNNEEARKFDFRGSPTLLINGNDMENMPVPENPEMACRYYPNGIPTTEKIKISIKKSIQKGE